jgi:outer membrane protein assembly factor BamB
VLFIGSCAGTFYAFDKHTGQVRWGYNIHQDGNQTSFHGNPLISESLILIGTDKSCAPDGIGHVYAFDKATGAVRWKYRTVGVPTDIAQIGSVVYAASFADELFALNLEDGSLRWKFGTGTANPDCELPSPPVVVGKRVLYAGFDNVLRGFDGKSGRELWQRSLGTHATTRLSIVGKSAYFGTSAGRLLRISADDGRIQGELPLPALPEGRILIAHDSLYVFLEDRERRAGYLIRTNLTLSQIQWVQKSSPDWSSEWPRLWNGLLLAGNCHGELNAFRSSDGVPQWSDKLKGCLRSIGTDGDGAPIYIGAQEGTVYAYSPPPLTSRLDSRSHERATEQQQGSKR